MKVHNTNDDLVVDFDDSISQTSETKTFKDDGDASASAAPAARAETKRRRQSVAAAHGLPNGVTHHFFLSHKKIHSQHGKVPAEIARSLKLPSDRLTRRAAYLSNHCHVNLRARGQLPLAAAAAAIVRAAR